MPPTFVRPSQNNNVPIGANLIALLKSDNTEISVSNSTVETQLWSYSIPGGTIGANDVLIYTNVINVLNNSGSTQGYTLRVKLAGSTIFTLGPYGNFSTGTTLGAMYTYHQFKNAGVTNSQKHFLWTVANATFVDANATSAIDMTAAQTISITAQCSVATATQTVTQWMAELWYIKQT